MEVQDANLKHPHRGLSRAVQIYADVASLRVFFCFCFVICADVATSYDSCDVFSFQTGPYAVWGRYGCTFDPTSHYGLHHAVQRGQNGTGPYIIEARCGNEGACKPDDSGIAGFLMSVEKYT